MRNVLFKLLTVILCIVLCVNFVRFILVTDRNADFKPVPAGDLLKYLSAIEADALPLYDGLYELLQYLGDIFEHFGDIFSVKYTGGILVLNVILNFFNFFYVLIVDVIGIISTLFTTLFAFVNFMFTFLANLYRFFNSVLGTNFSYST